MIQYIYIYIYIFRIHAKVDSELPRALLILSPPYYEPHTEDPLEVDNVQFECFIAGLTRMMLGLLMKTKRKVMVDEAFVLFSPVTLELNGGS